MYGKIFQLATDFAMTFDELLEFVIEINSLSEDAGGLEAVRDELVFIRDFVVSK